MKKSKVLLMTDKHILSYKLNDILKRKHDIEILKMDDVKKNKTNHFTAAFYGNEYIVFSTEFIFELLMVIERATAIDFFSRLFAVAHSEKIKIIFVYQKILLEKEFLNMGKVEMEEYNIVKNYVYSAVTALDIGLMIVVSCVYGISGSKDIIELLKNNEVEVSVLENITCPSLADKVALFVEENINSTGTIFVGDNGVCFADWLKSNYEPGFFAKTIDTKIREHQNHCVFNLVYKDEANAYYRGKCVAEKRIEIGKKLADCIPDDIKKQIDLITPVPRTGLYYAMGLSEGTGIPYKQVLIKGTYSERSFSMEDSDDRKKFLWSKIQPISELIEDKTIAVVDEAIFTGTTLKVVCEMLWNCNAKAVYLCIPTPPCKYHCEYLVHPKRKMLLEYLNETYLKEYFNVTGIIFQDEDFFMDYNIQLDKDVCMECFYGPDINS